MDHTGDDLVGVESCITMGDVKYALGGFQAVTHQYTTMFAGFSVSSIGGGVFQACVKSSAIGTSVNPVLNTPAAGVAASFSGPCDGAYILTPQPGVLVDVWESRDARERPCVGSFSTMISSSPQRSVSSSKVCLFITRVFHSAPHLCHCCSCCMLYPGRES